LKSRVLINLEIPKRLANIIFPKILKNITRMIGKAGKIF
jgi:hypothetical protein